jgi:hypothetical protein
MHRGGNQRHPHDFVMAIVFFGGFLALVACAYLFTEFRRRKRAKAIEDKASELGLEYTAEADGNFTFYLDGFELTSKGRNHYACNLLQGKSDSRALALFDYQYKVGHGKNSHTYHSTVLKIRFDGQPLPTFSLRPRTFAETVMGWFGRKGLDLGEGSPLSKQFRIEGDDPPAIREVLTAGVVDYLHNNPGRTIEAQDNTLLVYQLGKRLPPAELGAFLESGFELLAILNRQ